MSSQIRQVMSLSTKEYLDISADWILFHKLLHELKCWFLIRLLWNNFFSSIEVTDFSSQLPDQIYGTYMYVTSSVLQCNKKFPQLAMLFLIRRCTLSSYSMSISLERILWVEQRKGNKCHKFILPSFIITIMRKLNNNYCST